MKSNNKYSYLRKRLQQLDATDFILTKEADQSADVPFEQAFSDLAHAYLKDKAPTLLDYEVGFQLIDRNQENTKAIGVCGFKVGSQWLYAPVFFLNGDLKGHELLYIKNQDLFVPLKENWLNFLLNKKPNVLGKGVDKDLSSLGVMPPSLYQITRSPSKFASVNNIDKIVNKSNLKLAAWAKEVLPAFAHIATSSPLHDPKYLDIKTPLDLIKAAGSKGVLALIKHCEEYPILRTMMNDIYGEDVIQQTIKEAIDSENNNILDSSVLDKGSYILKDSRLTYQGPKYITNPANLINKQAAEENDGPSKPKKLRVISYTRIMELGHAPDKGTTIDLDSDDKSSLLKGEMKIEDERDDDKDEVSTAFNIEVPQQLQSPTETGLYEVLTKPNEFKKCLVVFGPYSEHRRETFVTVVDLESKAWLNTNATEVWTKTHYQKELFDKWYKDLDKGSLSKSSSMKLIILPRGQATLPFCVQDEEDAKLDIYKVRFQEQPAKLRPGSLPQRQYEDYEPINHNDKLRWFDFAKLVFTNKEGTALRAMGKELLIPKDHKVLSLDPCYCGMSSDPPAILELGTLVDFQMNIIKSGELKQIEVSHNGTFVRINESELLTPNDSIISLVLDHGLREKQARDIVEETRELKKQRYLIKYAKSYGPPYALQRSGPTAPPFPEPYSGFDPMTGGKVRTFPISEYNIPIPDLQSRLYDRSVYDPRPEYTTQPHMVNTTGGSPRYKKADVQGPDQDTMHSAMQAAQTGQKEVFETSMLGSLLNSVSDDSMTDKFLGDLIKGMDRKGRILFLYYWHKDEFEERFGKQDMPALEDGLKKAFEADGDLIIKLQQKDVGADASSHMGLHNLSD